MSPGSVGRFSIYALAWLACVVVGMTVWSLLSDPTSYWLSPNEQALAFGAGIFVGWVPLVIWWLMSKGEIR